MLALRELQSGIAGYILEQTSPELIDEVKAASLTRERRLNVYRNNVFTSLATALTSLYPAVEALVGEDFFQQLAHSYVKQYPSKTGDLHDFGEPFADFLSTVEPLAELPYIPGVAKLEWNYHAVFHAADAKPFDTSVLQSVAPEDYDNIQFVLHPATRLQQSSFPVLDVWRFAQDGTCQDDGPSENTLDLNKGGQSIAIRRRNNEMDFQLLAPQELLFLEHMAAGQILSKIEAALEESTDDYDLQTLLISQVQNGNIVDVIMPS